MKIEIFQDTVCPWCRIGKRNLATALQRWDGPPVEVQYRSYFLNGRMPPEGVDFRTHMAGVAGSEAALTPMFERVSQAGAEVGLTFHFDRITRAPNTELSHRLIAIAPEKWTDAVVDAVYRAYFEEGRDIGSRDVLVDIAAEVGMDPGTTRAALRGDAGRAEVRADIEAARQIGVTGVPFFILGGRYTLSGAHPPETLLRALQRVAEEAAAREG